MSDSDCPKCQGPRDAKALYCPFCGVIFARYSAAAAAPAPLAAPAMGMMMPALAPAGGGGGSFAPPTSPPVRPAETLYGGTLAPEQEAAWNPYSGPRAAPGEMGSRYDAVPTYQLAPRANRLMAQWLNGFALCGLLLLSAIPGGLLLWLAPESPAGLGTLVIGMILGLGIWLKINLRQLGETGQSMGKKWMDIRIVRTNGELAAVSHLVFVRYLSMQALGIIPVIGPIVGVVNVLLIFGVEQRCLHDRFADTVVIKA